MFHWLPHKAVLCVQTFPIWFNPHSGQAKRFCCFDFHQKTMITACFGSRMEQCGYIDFVGTTRKGRKKKLRSRMEMHYRSTNDGFVMQTKTSNTTLLKELKSKTQWHVLDVVGILGSLWNSLQDSCFSDPNSNKNLWNPWNYLMFCLLGRNSCPPSKEDSGQTGQSRIVPASVCSQDWDLPPIAPIAWNYVRYQFLSSFVP